LKERREPDQILEIWRGPQRLKEGKSGHHLPTYESGQSDKEVKVVVASAIATGHSDNVKDTSFTVEGRGEVMGQGLEGLDRTP